ncbi:hypothetical protein A6R68_06609, partial [Neotoma lepida]
MKLETLQLTHEAHQNRKWLMNHRMVLDIIIPMQGVVAHMVISADLLLLHMNTGPDTECTVFAAKQWEAVFRKVFLRL